MSAEKQAEKGRRALRGVYVPHDPVVLMCPEIGRTKQDFKHECDVNTVMKKYAAMGVKEEHLMQMGAIGGSYEDLVGVPTDLQEAYELVGKAEEAFMSVPAEIRKRFDNDPVAYLEFATNRENLEELREMGLAVAPEPEEGPSASPAPGGGGQADGPQTSDEGVQAAPEAPPSST